MTFAAPVSCFRQPGTVKRGLYKPGYLAVMRTLLSKRLGVANHLRRDNSGQWNQLSRLGETPTVAPQPMYVSQTTTQ